MIIEIEKVPFAVEYDTDDDNPYISSVKLHGYELAELISLEWLDVMLDKVIKRVEEDNEDSKYESAIDDYQNRWVEL